MPNSIARRALASFTGKLLSASAVSALLLVAAPATAQQQGIVATDGTAVFGPPEQFTVMFADVDALAGLLRRQGVADAEADAIENGVRKSLTAAQRKQSAILQLYFTGYYGSRTIDRVALEPASGSGTTLILRQVWPFGHKSSQIGHKAERMPSGKDSREQGGTETGRADCAPPGSGGVQTP